MHWRDGTARVPLRLLLGVERDVVMADLRTQLADVAALIADCVARTGEQAPAPAPVVDLTLSGDAPTTVG